MSKAEETIEEKKFRVDQVSRYAASLSVIEIGLGSIIHGLRIPMGGQWLSMNQGIVLSHAAGRLKKYASSSVITISAIVAILKSLSPAGKKLGPMLSISCQGFLFGLGLCIFGSNVVGIFVGTCLLSLWAFLQPFITLYFVYGHAFMEAVFFYMDKMKTLLGIDSEYILWIIGGLYFLKCLCGGILSIYFFRRSSQNISYVSKIREWAKAYRPSSKTYPSSTYHVLRSVFFDMTKPLFLFSFALMCLFFYFSHSDYAQVIWLSLRPLAVAFLLFFVSRHPMFYRFVGYFRKYKWAQGFFEVVDQTMKHLEENDYEKKNSRTGSTGIG